MTPNPKDRPRLGRGISSLLSPTATPQTPPASTGTPTPPSAPATNELPVDRIQPNPHQPRRQFNEASLAALADSMKAAGVIQPVVVRQVGDAYELIAGERRLRAAKLAGLATIPALIRETDAITQAQLALIENIQREDLNPIDRAEGYRVLIDQLGLTQAELAVRLGEDRSTIANFLRILDLHEDVRRLVRDGGLTVGHAKVLMTVADPADQARLADLAARQDLSVRNLERIVSQGPSSVPTRQTPPTRSAHIQDLEKSLARELGMRVNVQSHPRSKGKGKLVIHYASLDQFDTLLSRLGVNVEE